MIVGLPGAGKTTKAKEIEAEHSALRLTPDEWILALCGSDLNKTQRDEIRDPAELLQWQVAKRVLTLSCNVVLDWGFWARKQRMEYRKEAETLGAQVKIIFLDAPIEVLWSRIANRPESLKGTLVITREEFEHWTKIFEPPTKEELI